MSAGHRARVVLLAALTAVTLACAGEPSPPADATYTVRGEVEALPRGDGGELTVHHEAVPTFRDSEGRPSPMDSMSMPFAVAEGLALDGIAPGDKVEMTFEVRWQASPRVQVVALSELPPETPLTLGGPQLELVAPLGTPAER